MTSAPSYDNAVVRELEQKLQAREKTIALLTQRVDALAMGSGPSLPMLEQSMALEQMLAERTQELQSRHHDLEVALSELRQAQAKLLHSQKLEAIGSLAAGIAHEINTPAQFASDNTTFLRKSFTRLVPLIQTYKTLLEDLENGAIDSERIHSERERLTKAKVDFLIAEIPNALEGALEGLGRIGSIVRAMKEFSHPSNGLAQPYDLREIINTTVTVTKNEWKYLAELDTEFDPDLEPVLCLRDELSQVLVNLIVNATHAISSSTQNGALGKGQIKVSTHKVDGMAEIRVNDNGCGIPESIRHRVFEPFFTTKPVGSGTGQGLAIAYSVVVDKHGGNISFSSTEGLGTTFVVRLPLAINDTHRSGAAP